MHLEDEIKKIYKIRELAIKKNLISRLEEFRKQFVNFKEDIKDTLYCIAHDTDDRIEKIKNLLNNPSDFASHLPYLFQRITNKCLLQELNYHLRGK